HHPLLHSFPTRRSSDLQTSRDMQAPIAPPSGEAMGVLYVDSRFASRDISSVSNEILRVIAIEAASLIENARLVQAEEAARRYQQIGRAHDGTPVTSLPR